MNVKRVKTLRSLNTDHKKKAEMIGQISLLELNQDDEVFFSTKPHIVLFSS